MHSKKSRTIISIFLVFIAFLGILLYPMSMLKTSAAEDYKKWRQSDPRWASINLGNSSETMSSAGCLVTSLAVLAVHSGSKNAATFNPGTLAKSLNSIDAFSYGAIASWAKVTQVIPDVKFVKKYSFTSSTQSGKTAEMKAIFDDGYYIVCNVGNHWVFIDSIVGSEVYMIDPAKESTDLYDSYPLSSITELRVFTGKNPPQSTKPSTPTTKPTTKPTTQPTTEPTTEPFVQGEYLPALNDYVNIYASSEKSSKVIEYLPAGYVVLLTDVENGMGCMQLGAETGWLDMTQLEYAGTQETHAAGDINNDGTVDEIDLTLLNSYLASLSEFPDGISLLRECEIEAADINSDGIADNNDVLEYLALICE